MLLEWNRPIIVYLAPQIVRVAVPGRPILSRTPPSGTRFELAQAAAEVAPEMLGRRRPLRGMSVWIDDDWMRLFSVRWPNDVSNPAVFRRYLQGCFEQRFDLPATQWMISSPAAWPGRPALCAAMPREGMNAVRQLMNPVVARCEVTAYSIAEIHRALAGLPREMAVILGSVATQRSVFLAVQGRLIDFQSLPLGDAAVAFATQVFDARNGFSQVPRSVIRLLDSRETALDCLLERKRPSLIYEPIERSQAATLAHELAA